MMRALVLTESGPELRKDLPQPSPGLGEVLIRTRKLGICSTDLELIKGYAGFRGILGHEFVGEVVETGQGASDWLGRRVVGTLNVGCGVCPLCVGEGSEHCPRRTVLGIVGRDGAFAEYLSHPISNVLEVPDAVSDDVAVFTEPLAAALRIREQIAVRPTARVAVVGPGRLGLLIAQVLALGGGDPKVFGRSESSLELPSRLGLATGRIEEAESDAWDLVIEATGNENGLARALDLVRPQGTLVLKSTFEGKATVDLTKLVVGEIRVVGSRCGPFEPALRLLRDGAVEVLPLVEATYPLEQSLAALEHASRRGVRKVLLDPCGGA